MGKKKHMKQQAPVEQGPRTGAKVPFFKWSFILIAVLIAASFMLRIESFEKEHPMTFDESVYCMLAAQMIKSPGTYNTIAIYEDSLKKGRALPEYFKMPVFKHPPMFAWMISKSYTLFGMTYKAGFLVSLLMGTLLIVLAYLLGSALFDERTGLIAAAIMLIEPVGWITSQKIWMETSLAFFTVLSLALFALSIKRYNVYFLIASGIAGGLAALCKYPGLLAPVIITVYALIADRGLFRKKAFLSAIILPFMIIAPWLLRNFKAYGLRLDLVNDEVATIVKISTTVLEKTWYLIMGAAVLALLFIFIKYWAKPFYERNIAPKREGMTWVLCGAAVAAIFALVSGSVYNAFIPGFVPEAGWRIGMFYSKPWHFYLGRLIELSPFYIFSFAGLIFMAAEKELRKQYVFLVLSIAAILSLYILWRNFQCRYITASIVPLIVLGSRALDRCYVFAGKLKPEGLKVACVAILAVFVLYAVIKTVNIDIALAVPNNVCYF